MTLQLNGIAAMPFVVGVCAAEKWALQQFCVA
jgi:hypothetical protein